VSRKVLAVLAATFLGLGRAYAQETGGGAGRVEIGASPGGAVFFTESANGNEPQFGKLLDLAMLAYPGGRERTAAEWEELLQDSGFALTRIVPTEAAVSLIQAAPRF